MNRLRHVLLAAAPMALLAGCGTSPEDAALEERVHMEPGEYEITITGGKIAEYLELDDLAGSKRCIDNPPKHVPTALARIYTLNDEDCGTANFDREGNRLSGSNSCTVRDGGKAGSIALHFDGIVRPDSLTGTMRTEIDVDESQLSSSEKLALTVLHKLEAEFSAVRTGDC
jgi:hypothetical protein